VSESRKPNEKKQKPTNPSEEFTTDLVWGETPDAEERLRRAYELILRASKRSDLGDQRSEDN